MEKSLNNMVSLIDASQASCWFYRGEGAGNIVLFYQGSDPFLVGKVLRLRKLIIGSKHSTKKAGKDEENQLLSEMEQILWAEWPSVSMALTVENLIHAYARDVMSPLLSAELIDPGVLVSVSPEFLESVARNVEDSRPRWRADVSMINTCSTTALLLTDHCIFCHLKGTGDNSLSSVSVEIKPKCGFLPDSTLVEGESSIKSKVSRFAMHQKLKLKQGQVKAVSCYSPLDLFSGSREKISQAIHDLFDNPQNNLRVFVDGKAIDITSCKSGTEVFDRERLNNTLKSCISEAKDGRVEVLQRLVSQLLYETDALRKLLAVQKLDVYDIEGAIRAYNNFTDNGTVPVKENLNCSTHLESLTLEESRRVVRDYLIAATAKDCSLMLTFHEVPESKAIDMKQEHFKVVQCPETQKCFVSKIRFVDLDLKPVHKMPYYYKLDQDIIRAYMSTMKEVSA